MGEGRFRSSIRMDRTSSFEPNVLVDAILQKESGDRIDDAPS
jgi:hypothetical protein